MALPNNYAAIWNLTPQVNITNANAPESAFGLGSGNSEAVLGKDGRTLVNPADYARGGKYRSIIKLFIRYEGQPDDNNWGMGTGWLIRPDLLVTAGHCSYDFGRDSDFGKAVIARAYMGYSGKDTLEAGLRTGDVQMRMGKTFVTTSGWLQSEGSDRRSDISFLKLDKPFDGNDFNLFCYVDTPLSGQSELGVVGYPADKPNEDNTEKGSRMYELFVNTKWNVAENKRNMLSYPISTYRGQSGSPVIRKSDGVSIGAHVYGGANVNSASTIGGLYGNDFDAFLKVFVEKDQTVAVFRGINIVKTTAVATIQPELSHPNSTEVELSENFMGNESTTESFWDTLKDIGKVAIPLVSTGIQLASPLLGPVGPPAAGLAGVALGVLGKMCESAFDSDTQTLRKASQPTPQELDGIAQRAALAEAVLQTVLKVDSESPESRLILGKMARLYSEMSLQTKVAPKLFQCIAEPVLRIAMEPQPTTLSQTIQVLKPLPGAELSMSESGFTSTEAAFAAELLKPTIPVSGEESFFSFLGPAIKSGLKFATPLLKSAAKEGLKFVLSQLADSKTEASIDGETSSNPLAESLFRRAVVAECALQAVQQISVEDLKRLQLIDPNTLEEDTEGFFGSVKTSMQHILRKIVKTAPAVIRNVGPVAIDLLASAIETKTKPTESALTNGDSLSPPVRKLKAKTSIGAMASRRQPVSKVLKVSDIPFESSIGASENTMGSGESHKAVEQLVPNAHPAMPHKPRYHNRDGLAFLQMEDWCE